MSINLIHNKNINRDRWDKTIDESTISSPTLQSWYLDIMCPDWQAIIKEDYSMVMPIVPSNDLDHYIPYSGVISINQIYSEDIEEFISKIPERTETLNLNPTNWLLTPGNTELIETEQLSIEYPYKEIQEKFDPSIVEYSRIINGHILEVKNIPLALAFIRKSMKVQYNEEALFTRISDVITHIINNKKGIAISHINDKKQITSLVILLFNQNYIHLFLAISDHSHNIKNIYQLLAMFIKENDMSTTLIDIPRSNIRHVQINPKLIGTYNIRYQKWIKSK